MVPKSNNSTLSSKILGYAAQTSLYGRPIPVIFGRCRVAANVIWTGGWTATPVSGGKGNKGKGGSQQYDYITNVLFALGEGLVSGVYQIWRDKDAFNLAYQRDIANGVTSYRSTIGGTGNPYWWVLNVAVVRDDGPVSVTVTDPGSPGPVTITGHQWFPMELVPASPGPGQYTLSGVGSVGPPDGYGHYGFSAADAASGKNIYIVYAYQINNFSQQGSPMTHLNLTLFAGQQSQAPWVYLTSNPNFVSQALGYSQTAYVGSGVFDLGSAGVIPSLNFEVQGRSTWGGWDPTMSQAIVDCNPADMIANILTSPLDGVLGWATPSVGSGYGPVVVSGVATVTGTAMVVTTGSLATLSVGQQIVVNGVSTVVDAIADATHGTLHDTVGDGSGLTWNANVTSTFSQVNGSSVWLPASGASSLGPTGQVYKYCAANGLFLSHAYDQTSPAREIINHLLEAANSDAFWSEGLLKFGCYGDTTAVGNGQQYSPSTQPIYDITDDDMVCGPGEEPVQFNAPDITDVHNEVSLEWTNRSAAYAHNVLPAAQDAASIARVGRRPSDSKTFPEINSQPVAVAIQNTMLKRSVYIDGAGNYIATFFPHFALLDPMDLVTLTDLYTGLDFTPLRITRIEEDESCCLKVTMEPFPWSTSAPTLYPAQGHTPTIAGYYAAPGHVNNPLFFQLPQQVTQGNAFVLGIGLSGGENWGGAAVFVSSDGGNSYESMGVVTGAATMGFLTAVLGVTADPDTATHSVQVTLTESYGELPSFTMAQADDFVSLIVVDDEVMSYETADLLGTYQYGLTYVRRGVYGSTIASHAIGATFAVVNSLFQYPFDASVIGKTLYFKFCSVNLAGQQQEDLSQVIAYPITMDTAPPAPTYAAEQSAIDPTVLEITGLTFPSDPNNFAIATGTFRVYYVDPNADDYILDAQTGGSAPNLGPTDTSVKLDSPAFGHAPISALAGKFARFGTEIVLCGTPSGNVVPITRAQLGSTAASWNQGSSMLPVILRSVNTAFPSGLFSNPLDLNNWELDVPLPNMVVVAVAAYCTNYFGDGSLAMLNTSNNVDFGIPLTAPAPGTTTVVTYNPPANTDFTIATGNVLYNVVATTRNCTASLPPEVSDVGNTVQVKLSAGSTFNCIVQESGGDTIDGSGSPITVTPSAPYWSGLGN